MSQIQTKYITPDEFRDYFGIDLMLELPDDTNPSNKAMAFLKRIEDRVETIIDTECFRQVNREYPNFSDYQKCTIKEHYWNKLCMCFTTPIFRSIAAMTLNTASLPIEKRFKTFLSHRMQNESFNSAGFGVKNTN